MARENGKAAANVDHTTNDVAHFDKLLSVESVDIFEKLVDARFVHH
jgi:hypothetical protein